MKMKTIVFVCFTILLFSTLLGEELILEWEASVNYGTYGQRTVVVNDTLLCHLGGRTSYGVPFNAPYDYSFIETFSSENGYWQIQETTTIRRSYINAESYNNKVYIIGGNDYPTFPNEVEIYDPYAETIYYGSPLPYPVKSAGSVQYNGKIYIIGGSDETTFSNILQIYDINSDSWSTGEPLPIPMETEAIYYNGNIYVMGGYDVNVHDEIYKYNISTDSWNLIGNMPYLTSAHKLAVYQNYVFVVGDYQDVSRIMRYNLSDQTWIIYDDTNYIGRRHTSLALYNDKLLVIAGNSYHNNSYQYYRIVQSIDLSQFTSIENPGLINTSNIKINQNFPNPFNPTTTIDFELKKSGFVRLKVFNIKGQLVDTLVNEEINTGKHSVVWKAKGFSSGQYFYQISIDGKTIQAKKAIVLK